MATAINVETFGGFHRGRTDLDRLRANRYGQLELLVPTLARDLHFASAADAETDWAVANPTHPTHYWHSETTPATDYISMYHDATSGFFNVASGTMLLQIDATTVVTVASGSVTSSQDVIISSGFGLNVGSATQVTISNGDGATNLIPEGQFLGVGTAFAGGALVLGTFNTTNDRTVSPKLAFLKGAAATQVATTAVADNEVVGSIIAYGSDSADFETPVAAIEFVVDDVGAPGAGAIGGSLEFYTTADAGETLTLSFTINNDQNIYVANNNGVVVGHTAQITAGVAGEFQILGTAATDATQTLGYFAADTGSFALRFVKSRNATIGGYTIAVDADSLGQLIFYVDDGVDYESQAASIVVSADATYGADDTPGRIVFNTTPDGTATAIERLRIASTGLVTIAAGSTPASVATTPGTAHAGSITVTGGLGGNTTIGTTGTGGIGAGYSFTGGAGGTANSATTAATGGAGGAFAVTTGAGAAAAVAGVDSTGGAGGAVTITTGAGGAVSLAVSGTATGGAAGLLTIQGGVGGAVTATTGTNVGGAGGGVSVIAGAGGAASGATDTGGAGGTVTITAGAGGNGDTSGAAGNVAINAGAAGTGGNIAGGGIKMTAGAAVGTGAIGAVIASGTVLMDDRTITTISTDSDVIYTAAQVRTGVIIRDSITANRNDSMPTAANLVAGIPNAEVGTSFFFALNNNDDASTLTMTTAAAGITYDGNVGALAAAAARLYLVVITNVGGGTEAATVFGL